MELQMHFGKRHLLTTRANEEELPCLPFLCIKITVHSVDRQHARAEQVGEKLPRRRGAIITQESSSRGK